MPAEARIWGSSGVSSLRFLLTLQSDLSMLSTVTTALSTSRHVREWLLWISVRRYISQQQPTYSGFVIRWIRQFIIMGLRLLYWLGTIGQYQSGPTTAQPSNCVHTSKAQVSSSRKRTSTNSSKSSTKTCRTTTIISTGWS